ncbi:MAG: DEAD/DEAH box helicase, partial [Methanoregulaceae archaeon]|nr:DEAD/DEAH box helicase [Methanoregulaceae archaeon]
PFTYINVCRVCLLEERVTELDEKTAVRYGTRGDRVCMDCARRELRREAAHMGRLGRGAASRLEELLLQFRDIDRVLASIQPEEGGVSQTLFDRLDAHPVAKTAGLEELPLPRPFVDASGIGNLMPVQQLAVEAGLLYGKDLLVVSATASGKTFIGEMAGLKNVMEGRGRMLFLVPLVALAVQKYQRFAERYGVLADVGILIGKSRINLPDTRPVGDGKTRAPVLVGTYEGLDHMIRTGGKPGKIGTVVIDEIQMLEDPDRGHRLDGLIARLKYLAPNAQFLYLSATIGAPKTLAKKLGASLVTYSERPVSLERYLMFVEKKQKIPIIQRLALEEYGKISSKGFHGQTIVFTNTRARCHVVAEALGPRFAPYHAGLTAQERREVEKKFLEGKLAGVITTAALAAGVDFPASQVIFDTLAMGISWLSVSEFNQMSGRAGRPDFHDLGKVVVLAEPGASYSRESTVTEEEMAIRLLRGEVEEVAPVHDFEQSSEEFVANAVACEGNVRALSKIADTMVGSIEPVEDLLLARGLIHREGDRIVLTDLARVMAEHFIGVERLLEILQLTKMMDDPVRILTELECEEAANAEREKALERAKREIRRGPAPPHGAAKKGAGRGRSRKRKKG